MDFDGWSLLAHKAVRDVDGFMTDYVDNHATNLSEAVEQLNTVKGLADVVKDSIVVFTDDIDSVSGDWVASQYQSDDIDECVSSDEDIINEDIDTTKIIVSREDLDKVLNQLSTEPVKVVRRNKNKKFTEDNFLNDEDIKDILKQLQAGDYSYSKISTNELYLGNVLTIFITDKSLQLKDRVLDGLVVYIKVDTTVEGLVTVISIHEAERADLGHPYENEGDSNQSNTEFKEALEDSEEEIPSAPKGDNIGIANLINALIKDEWDAVDGYQTAIATLRSLDGDNEDAIIVFQEIANDEYSHVGNLQKILNKFAPQVETIADGEREAEKVMKESLVESKEDMGINNVPAAGEAVADVPVVMAVSKEEDQANKELVDKSLKDLRDLTDEFVKENEDREPKEIKGVEGMKKLLLSESLFDDFEDDDFEDEEYEDVLTSDQWKKVKAAVGDFVDYIYDREEGLTAFAFEEDGDDEKRVDEIEDRLKKAGIGADYDGFGTEPNEYLFYLSFPEDVEESFDSSKEWFTEEDAKAVVELIKDAGLKDWELVHVFESEDGAIDQVVFKDGSACFYESSMGRLMPLDKEDIPKDLEDIAVIKSDDYNLNESKQNKPGMLGYVLEAHKDELAKITNPKEALEFLNRHEEEILDKKYLTEVRKNIVLKKGFKAVEYLYNIILKGEDKGRDKEESLAEGYNEDEFELVKKEVLDILEDEGYDVSKRGTQNYAFNAADYICMTRNYGEEYSVEQWWEDTQNFPEALRKLPKIKPLKEGKEENKLKKEFESRDLWQEVYDAVTKNLLTNEASAKKFSKVRKHQADYSDVRVDRDFNLIVPYRSDEDRKYLESVADEYILEIKEDKPLKDSRGEDIKTVRIFAGELV